MDIVVPDIGDFDEVAVIELLAQPGDAIKLEQSLITVESDKASMEIPSSHAGVLKELKVKIGDKVSKGTLIAVMQAAARGRRCGTRGRRSGQADVAAAPAPAAAPAAPAPRCGGSASAGGAERGVAACLAVDPPLCARTRRAAGAGQGQRAQGPHHAAGRAGLRQVGHRRRLRRRRPPRPQRPAAAFPGLLPWPQVDFAKFGPIERKDLSRIKKISGANLHRNWVLIPHVTNNDEADITDLEAFRVQLNKENEKSGVKVTMLAFVIKAVVAALKKFPDFNASLDGDALVYKKYFHIGFAADTPNGLVVPVLKDADKKGLLQVAAEMGELSKKARDGKMGPADMSGGCFSISSLGGIGGTHFTPIINAPEVAILGLSKGYQKPVWDGKAFVPRLTLPLSLSYDHRVIDGASAARFNAYLASILADFRRVLL